MGPGYWVWLIPLGSGSTSVGIVVDARLHPLETMSTYDKAFAWLERHEPQCAERLRGRKETLQDFRMLKDYSYSCETAFSADRWSMVGEACAFLDPFYSPGSDYIAMGNTLTCDLIVKDLDGIAVADLGCPMLSMHSARECAATAAHAGRSAPNTSSTSSSMG